MTQNDELETVTTEEDIRILTVQREPQSVSVYYYYRGNAYENKQDCARAIDLCSEAIKKNQNDKIAYINRGAAYELNGEYELAIKDYSKVIELDLKCSIAYNNLGSAYYGMKNHVMAQVYWNEALQLDRNNAEVRKNIELIKK
jgi:stress-induced-phosphoprotein 1